MKNYSKKIITSVLTLVIMVVALGTGVFAWFTMNTKTEATNLTGSAEAGDGGFYISDDGITWDNFVSLSGIDPKGSVGQTIEPLTDLTTTDGKVLIKRGGTNDFGKGYFEFDLYFITGSTYKYIYLVGLEIDSDETSWSAEKAVSDGDRSVVAGDTMKSKLANAIRVSLVDKNSQTATAKIFENPADTPNFESSGTTKTLHNTTGFADAQSNFAALYYEAIHGETLVVPVARGDIVIGANGVVNEFIVEATDEDNEPIDTFTHEAAITVRVWIEGWDQEAFNAILGGEVTINFYFEVKEE